LLKSKPLIRDCVKPVGKVGIMRHVAFATYQESPEITDDDPLVADLLRKRGINVSPAVWDAPGIDWSQFNCVVIRSTWDYHLKSDRYAAWLHGFRHTDDALWNAAQAVLENMSKRYLLSLAAQGIDVVPTVFQTIGGSPVGHGDCEPALMRGTATCSNFDRTANVVIGTCRLTHGTPLCARSSARFAVAAPSRF
jgi:hypothetical protein